MWFSIGHRKISTGRVILQEKVALGSSLLQRKIATGNLLLQILLLTSVLLFALTLSLFVQKPADALTILYSGAEYGQLGLHGCGAEQVGGLARRHTLITNLCTQPDVPLNLHIGNLIDATDENAEWIYQIGLTALDAMHVDVLCLGPNELSLPLETLKALHANYPDMGVVCANMAAGMDTPYLIRTISKVNVAIVGLVSQTYTQDIRDVELIPSQTALAELKAELTRNSDFVVVVFHATHAEAQRLAESAGWVDVLIVANSEQQSLEVTPVSPTFIGKTAIVTDIKAGAAVGVLRVHRCFSTPLDMSTLKRDVTNRYHVVSEKLTPDANILQLLAAYQALSTTVESFDTAADVVSPDAVHIAYFHKHGCQKCARAVKILKRVQEKYPHIVVEQQNAKTAQTLLEAMGTLYEVPQTKRLTTPAVFIGDTALIGDLDEQQLESAVQRHLPTGAASRLEEAAAQLSTAESEIVKRFHGFGILAVAGAGLLDGINPCAFATIVFFISYMTLVGRGRKEMLIAGGAFAIAVFSTYLLLGLGTLSFMHYLNRFSGVATGIYLVAAAATFALGGLSLYDAVKAKQGKTKEILLQLPRALKLRIHKVIREQTRTSGVIAGAIVIGCVISALELVCTGQVYLPTLTFVAGIDGMRAHAIAYLLLYNLMFIVPLLVVFGCVYWGTTSVQLGGVLQRHLVTVKVGIGLLLFGLGTWLVLSVLA